MAKKRKHIPKSLRLDVYNKYSGHCGYCGCEIEMKGMQVDHIKSVNRGGDNTFQNLMPSCRMCNYYKHTYSLEEFRKEMHTIHERIAKPFITRLGMKYGIVHIKKFNGVFYFEEYEISKK